MALWRQPVCAASFTFPLGGWFWCAVEKAAVGSVSNTAFPELIDASMCCITCTNVAEQDFISDSEETHESISILVDCSSPNNFTAIEEDGTVVLATLAADDAPLVGRFCQLPVPWQTHLLCFQQVIRKITTLRFARMHNMILGCRRPTMDIEIAEWLEQSQEGN